MTNDDAIAGLSACEPELKAEGVTALYLFGSTADGTAGEASDLDLFIDFDKRRKFSLFDLVGVKLLIEDRLAREADLTTRESLHAALRADIERSAIRVF